MDDTLVNYDNDRARATLSVLAGLSRKLQVILFSHHAHLVEIARQHLDQEDLFVHELSMN